MVSSQVAKYRPILRCRCRPCLAGNAAGAFKVAGVAYPPNMADRVRMYPWNGLNDIKIAGG